MCFKFLKAAILTLLFAVTGGICVQAQDVLSPGFLKVEFYDNIQGTPIDGLTSDPKYPNSPDSVDYWSVFGPVAAGNNHGDNFGARVTGFVLPPATGDYKFYLRSDDAGQLWLSTDDTPANLALIAEQTGCCNAFQDVEGTLSSTPVTLTVGKRYFIQGLYKEGGGDDYIQVAWRKPGEDLNDPNGLQPIPAAYLATMAPSAGKIVTITKQPSDVSAAQNDFATFSLDATSTNSPILIQWQKNGVSVPGLTGSIITLGPLAASDNGAKFSAVVSVPGASTNSAEATLTVTADITLPRILRVIGSDTFDTVTVDFSEAVTAASAGAAANYSLDGGLTVSSATVVTPAKVKLATSKQTTGATYTLTIKNIIDTAGNTNAPDTKMSFSAFGVIRGGLKLEAYFDIAGTPVQNLLDDPKYQSNSPDFVGYVTQFTSRLVFPDNQSALTYRENYGGRLSGWIVPAETAQYEFFIRSDDASQLSLSTDEKPENLAMIAEEIGCCGPFEQPGAPETSAPIALTSGKQYYIQALWKEGGGGDYCDVAWRKVGDPAVAQALPYISGNLLETLAAPGTFTPPTVAISSPAEGSSFEAGTNVTLTASVSAAGAKTITKVEFFELSNKIGEATTSPYSITVSGLTEDAHKFTARATDSAGIFVDSAPVTISVGGLVKKVDLVLFDGTWRYDRSGLDLGTAWSEKGYDDSKWPEGKTLIADETTVTVEPIRTPITRFNDAGEYVTTFYFRTHFNFTDVITPGVKLLLRHAVDDGAIFYLNGVEIHRFGFDAGVVVDFTTSAAGHENDFQGPFDIPLASLVKGDNILTAEVHQSGTSSSDMVFGAELIATVPATTATILAIDDKIEWRYDRSGLDLGTAWKDKVYDDSKWPQGKALIADETTVTVEPIRTPITRFNDAGEYVTTFYFRTHFDFSGETASAKLKLRHVVDDGGIFYLNGVEIHRFGFDPGVVVDFITLAAGHENDYQGPFDIPVASLATGDNVLAAEVHQSSTSSSDMVFGAELVATFFGGGGSGSTTNVPPPAPKFNPAVLQQGGNVVLSWTGTGTLQEANEVTGSTWSDVPNANNPFTVSVLGKTRKFYRLKQ